MIRGVILAAAASACAGAGGGVPVPDPPSPVAVADSGTVILLHGLGRSPRSMRPLERSLTEAGYRVLNLGYPSRTHSVEELAGMLADSLDACCAGTPPLHFVTHSLGGILVRAYAARAPDRVGRVVMLSPPNAGSQVVDRLPDDLLRWVLGPASLELSADSGSAVLELAEPRFELGVITGDRTLNPLFSWWIPGPDDGKVAVESARIEGAELLVVSWPHAFIMRSDRVAAQVIAFLRTGAFAAP